jgi:hypothetical protein
MELTEEQVDFFHRNGWVLHAPFDAREIELLRLWVSEIQCWPDNGGDWLHYREMTDDGPQLCRTENFIPYHDGMRSLLVNGRICSAVGQLMGQPASLYKEKINYKLAGGAGFLPHQDAPAYPFIRKSVSVMVAVDDSTVDNGCLEVVSGMHHELIPTDDRGCIEQQWAGSHVWEPVPMVAGEVLFFHSHTPHRSATNNTSSGRRALYPTYNAASEGDLRDDYYAEKLRYFAQNEESGDRVRVSLIDDFMGRPV